MKICYLESIAQSEIDEVLWTCVLDTFCDERGFDFISKRRKYQWR